MENRIKECQFDLFSDRTSAHTVRDRPFTSLAFTTRLQEAGIRVSMDGSGQFMDNIFIERLWRSLKC